MRLLWFVLNDSWNQYLLIARSINAYYSKNVLELEGLGSCASGKMKLRWYALQILRPHRNICRGYTECCCLSKVGQVRVTPDLTWRTGKERQKICRFEQRLHHTYSRAVAIQEDLLALFEHPTPNKRLVGHSSSSTVHRCLLMNFCDFFQVFS